MQTLLVVARLLIMQTLLVSARLLPKQTLLVGGLMIRLPIGGRQAIAHADSIGGRVNDQTSYWWQLGY